MTILIIDNSIAFTGAFKCALNEAELLSDQHRFVFVLPQNSSLVTLLERKGYTVYTLPLLEIRRNISTLLKYPFVLMANTHRLKKIVQREKVQAIQVNDFYNLLGACAKLLGFKGRLYTYVRFLPSVMPGPLRKLWISAALKYSEKVIAVSDAVLNQLPQNPKAQRLYDPVSMEERLPAKSSMERDTINILYLGNFIKGKGQDYALDAFSQAYRNNPGLRLSFVGGDMGLQKNAEFRQSLIDKALQRGLADVVSFKPFNSNVEEEIKAADLVLNFSDAESFSMTCLEAAFYGTALIATRCGGPEEIIVNEETGLTVEKGDIEAMATAILRMSNDPALRNKFSVAGKAYVRQKFSIEGYRKQAAAIFE